MANQIDSNDFVIQTIVSNPECQTIESINLPHHIKIFKRLKEYAPIIKAVLILVLLCFFSIGLVYNLLVPKEHEIPDEVIDRVFKLLPIAIGQIIKENNFEINGIPKSARKDFQRVG
ncbi:MAG: hypothetical protein FD143_3482 [Ignavibacteria bacterium]|nr:MAG: hypothetical protein FD143_3482 [Ignavibacteria bacterium]